MSKRQYLTIATMICASGLAGTAHSKSLDCSTGELTLSRLAGIECIARIPLPTARPDAVKTAATAPVRTWEFIETPGAAPGETRMVRIVGSRFLPDRSESIDFRAHSSSQAGLLDAAFHRAAAYVGFAAKDSGSVAEDFETQVGVVQEARADLSSIAVRN